MNTSITSNHRLGAVTLISLWFYGVVDYELVLNGLNKKYKNPFFKKIDKCLQWPEMHHFYLDDEIDLSVLDRLKTSKDEIELFVHNILTSIIEFDRKYTKINK